MATQHPLNLCRPQERIHQATTDDESASESLLWLRLVTSAHMRANRDEFEPYCADENRTFDGFLAADVETMGVEADEMQAAWLKRPRHHRHATHSCNATLD